MSTSKYSVKVPPDTEGFTPSVCKCQECMRMHHAQDEWDTFTPKTHLQNRMKDVISRIERRIASSESK